MNNVLSWKHLISTTAAYDKYFGYTDAKEVFNTAWGFFILTVFVMIFAFIADYLYLKRSGYKGTVRNRLLACHYSLFAMFGIILSGMLLYTISTETLTHVQYTNMYSLQDGVVKEYKLTEPSEPHKHEYVYKVYKNVRQANGLNKLVYSNKYISAAQFIPSDKLYALK